LAIITMQMMPKISWPQRVASDAVARDEIASVVLVVTVSSIPAALIELSDETSRLAADPYLFMSTRAYRGARHVSAFDFATHWVVPNEISLRVRFRWSLQPSHSPADNR
jgi:hypothetical protein